MGSSLHKDAQHVLVLFSLGKDVHMWEAKFKSSGPASVRSIITCAPIKSIRDFHADSANHNRIFFWKRTQNQKNITSTPKMNLSLTALTVYTLLMSVLVEVTQAAAGEWADSANNWAENANNYAAYLDEWGDAAVKTGKRAATGM